MKKFSFKDAIEDIINEINLAKLKAESIHKSSNIRSSGDEVEDLIRSKVSLFLPERYLVKQGQIIDDEGNVSNQFDIIIFDRLSTPKFFESRNGTVYYPIESVLAIGEIKKTLTPKHTKEFAKSIYHFKHVMKRKLKENTFHGLSAIKADIRDVLNFDINQKYKNPLYSFVFAIDGILDKTQIGEPIDIFTNDIIILNNGCRFHGAIIDGKFKPLVSDDADKIENILNYKGIPSENLSVFLDVLIRHLNRCKVEPFSISNYISKDILVYNKEKVEAKDISGFRTLDEIKKIIP
ncbi:hypothetical protein SAMN05443633_104402 [Chryseobacterium arachidis]|uniref:DUF6602 domain-containing protein n=1 Tax=Chryseobacterium arachidis TaxID=1416778 RepID=A0A1M5C4Y6_9FLAO|nr:DUF6602 domain-containing protein [Chryseobacterium arachidis]SHF49696.1 hypothetical protein SAMN05443633_104402 [Chryseobacterium arachidis]